MLAEPTFHELCRYGKLISRPPSWFLGVVQSSGAATAVALILTTG